jgi:hypothetical protein
MMDYKLILNMFWTPCRTKLSISLLGSGFNSGFNSQRLGRFGVRIQLPLVGFNLRKVSRYLSIFGNNHHSGSLWSNGPLYPILARGYHLPIFQIGTASNDLLLVVRRLACVSSGHIMAHITKFDLEEKVYGGKSCIMSGGTDTRPFSRPQIIICLDLACTAF